MSESSSESELLASFNKRFGHTLPLQYIDLVVVKSLEQIEEPSEAGE